MVFSRYRTNLGLSSLYLPLNCALGLYGTFFLSQADFHERVMVLVSVEFMRSCTET